MSWHHQLSASFVTHQFDNIMATRIPEAAAVAALAVSSDSKSETMQSFEDLGLCALSRA
jgi:hypothetical protein